MPDPVASPGSAAAKRAAGPPSKLGGAQPPGARPLKAQPPGARQLNAQPLKSKAEKRAEAKATKARNQAMQRRRRALAMAGTAAVVLALLVGLIVWIGNSSQPNPTAATATTDAAPSPAAATPNSTFPPVPTGADPALRTKPAAEGGIGTVTELKTTTLVQGTGPAVQSGQTIQVNYVGVTYADGKEFDSSWDRSEAFSFPVGAGNVIQGWDQGLLGVEVGSRVQLDIPSDQAYGDKPTGGRPAGALRFIVDVLSAS
ncbi:FKBP-type peptidyl-prolyl cis-trans isomerase [Actinoplanes sp. DH11]|uniref:FKBP-type peptidyl-prolyl cis-trans isomerase n=1 Tax=Actinoplanes sp. DH11 TaxID=2857011 RepID=UPI001E475AA5|nr:FKBP-type peptidyl-prolyl cis-trans isomerase [Actinoplanes sp. DH11]